MDELIQSVIKQFGISAEQGKSAVGGVVDLMKHQLDDETFSQISRKVPGLQAMLDGSKNQGTGKEGGEEDSGGLLGTLASAAGSILGGKAKSVADIAAILNKSGLSLEKLPQFLSLVSEFLKNKLGKELFAVVLSKLPDLLGKK